MTAYDFQPSSSAPFQFQPTLDGSVYTVVVKWSLAGQRYYAEVSALDGTLIATVAVVGSPLGYDINLVGGYFASSIVFREASQQFEVSP